MAKKQGAKRKIGAGDVASNRYASYRYELLERLECGILLAGTEVKALRTSGAQLKEGYVAIRGGELWLHGVHIPPYAPASRENHDPERDRKLLAHRSRAKVEIALARGKDLYDKRNTIREREVKRDMERAMSARR